MQKEMEQGREKVNGNEIRDLKFNILLIGMLSGRRQLILEYVPLTLVVLLLLHSECVYSLHSSVIAAVERQE